MDTGSYISLNIGNPLCYILGGSLCYIVSGVAVLVVGVIITSVTFQNLDHHHEANKERYAGPILICAGILIMGKGAVFRIKECECRTALKRRWDKFCRRLVREDSEAAIYLGPTDSEDGYSDDPPPYDAVAVMTGSMITSRVQLDSSISSSLPSLPPYDEGLVNPGLDLSTEVFPAPPPYEVVAVQPPCYSVGIEGVERPVRAMTQHIRSGRRKVRDPTRHTVQEVAQRLAQTMHAQETLRAAILENEDAAQMTDTSDQSSEVMERSEVREGQEVGVRSGVFENPEVVEHLDLMRRSEVMERSLTDSIEAHLEALEQECLRDQSDMNPVVTQSLPPHQLNTCVIDCSHQESLDLPDDDQSGPSTESLSISIPRDPSESCTEDLDSPDTPQNFETNVHIEMESETECGYSPRNDGDFSLEDVDNANVVHPCASEVDKDQSIEVSTTVN